MGSLFPDLSCCNWQCTAYLVHISFWILIWPGYSLRHWLLVHGELSFPFRTCTLFCLGAVCSFIPPAPWRLSFSPGPLHHVLFEDSLMMLVRTVARYAIVVVLICMSLSTGEFVHPFHELFFFFFKIGNKIDVEIGSLKVGHVEFLFWSPSSGYLVTAGVIYSSTVLVNVASRQLSRSVVCSSLWPMDCSTPGFPVLHCLQSLLILMSIKSVMPSNHLILCCPLLLLPSVFPSIRDSSNDSSGQSNGVSGSASVLPMNIQGWFPLGLTGWISLQSKGLKNLYRSTVRKHQFFSTQFSLWPNSHIHIWLTGKTIALPICSFVGRVMSLLFNTLSKFVIAFLPRSKHHLISWRQSLSTVIFCGSRK